MKLRQHGTDETGLVAADGSEQGRAKTGPQKVQQLGLELELGAVARSGGEASGHGQKGSFCDELLAHACERFGGHRELGKCKTCEDSKGMEISVKRNYWLSVTVLAFLWVLRKWVLVVVVVVVGSGSRR